MTSRIFLYQLCGNTISRYIVFIAVLTGCIILLKLFRKLIFSRIKKYAESTDTEIDDLFVDSFQENVIPLMYIGSVFLSLNVLDLHSRIEKWSGYLFLILVVIFLTRFLISIVILFISRIWLVNKGKEERNTVSSLIGIIVRIILWSVSVLFLLDNLGVKVSGLIAGLGVGGIAIAFAAQSILRDIFNYFTIFFDKPFEIGDFLVVDEFSGSVEHVGVKTTRLRSLNGEQIIFANTDLTGSRVRNYKNMRERRIKFSFGVTYDTPARKIKLIPEELRKIVEEIDGTRFDRAHFKSFGDSSLDFEVVYHVLSGEYINYMDIQQAINLKIMELLKKMKVEFAYPTRTLFIQKNR